MKKTMQTITVFLVILLMLLISCGGKKLEKSDKDNIYYKLNGVFHVVAEGDTLSEIALTYGIPVEDILEANDFNEKTLIYPNNELFIPNVSEIKKVVKKVDATNISIKIETKKGGLELGDEYKERFIWSVDGVLVLKFGKSGKIQSDGIDIAAPLNTDIKSILNGKIIYSGEQGGYGNIVIIQHQKGIVSIYAGNSVNLVKEGEAVLEGQTIGKVGKSGERAMLHFEIRNGVKPINPLPYLKKQ